MATADTVHLGPPHEPKKESLLVFEHIEHELKRQLVHIRHDLNKHEPRYFAAASDLSDANLAAFTSANFEQVRVAASAYGVHLFGKLRIPALPDSGPAFVHFRAFDGNPEAGGAGAKLHSIHTEDKELDDGQHSFRAIFTDDDPLEWFDT